MPEPQPRFVHWQNREYEAWYEITGRKTEIVPGSFHTLPDSKYDKETELSEPAELSHSPTSQ
jgi:hypothetical protein